MSGVIEVPRTPRVEFAFLLSQVLHEPRDVKGSAEELIARRDDHAAFDMETIWGHAPQVPLGGNPNPGMWMYGDTLARLRRLAPGVLHNDLKACNDYVLEGEVRCPALFVLGKRDVMTPPRAAAELQAKLKGRTVMVELSGHSLMAEAPDATLDALIDFLS